MKLVGLLVHDGHTLTLKWLEKISDLFLQLFQRFVIVSKIF